MGGGIAKVVAALVAVILMIGGGARAMTVCNVTEEGLTACRPSVTPPDPTPPSSECCDAVSGADMKCLCSYKNSYLLPSLGIDPDLALALPAKCDLPSPNQC